MAKIIQQKMDIVLDAIFLVFQNTKYLVVAFILASLMALTYPLLFPIAVGSKKISILAFRAGLLDVIILVLISTLFGVIVAMQIFKFKKIKDYKKTGANLFSASIGLLSSKACCLLPLILLTLGATTGIAFFIKYTTEIRIIGLFILILSLYWTSSDIIKNNCCGQTNRGEI